MITRLAKSSLAQDLPRYRSMLAGNDAYIPTSFESIATATGTGSSATISFTSIPSTYQHLQIRAIGQNADTGTRVEFFRMRINGDTTAANYVSHYLQGNGTSASASNVTGVGALYIGNTATNLESNVVGGIIIDIHDYASTTKNKTVRSFTGVNANTADTDYTVMLSSGLWASTSAISSIDLLAGGYNWTTKTTFALYGIKGA